MGQKVQPTGFRVGIFEDWSSRWYASKKDFADLLVEDCMIRRFIKQGDPRWKKRKGRGQKERRPVHDERSRDRGMDEDAHFEGYASAGIPKIEIERTRDEVKVMLHAARPGLIIGKKGEEVDRLQRKLQELTGRRINIKIIEINRPQINAQLVAEDIAEQLERRSSFRRTMKRASEQVMENGAKGIKILLAGRLGGAEMARRESVLVGSVPLATLRAKISYGFTEAKTAQGHIGVKVWINQGFYDTEDADGADAPAGQVPQKSKRKSKR